MRDRLVALRGWLAGLPWLRIAGATVLAIVVIGVVPPFRRAAARVVSKMILVAASPLAPDIRGFDALPEPSRVLAADGSELGFLDGTQRKIDPVHLAALPPHVRRAVLAAEDADFYHHSGVDPSGVLRAVFVNIRGGHTQGGSTITQQLAKLNYTGSQRTFLRKLKEILYAERLEQRYSKDQLLERYLNQVYFGDGNYGLAAASQAFFGVPADRLTPAQAATLAGKIRAPDRLDPERVPHDVQVRRNEVLAAMRRHGWLDQAAYDQAATTPVQTLPQTAANNNAIRAPHFIRYVAREAGDLDELGGSPESRGKQLYTGGYTIQTTLDPKAFDAATAAVKSQLGAPGDPTTAVVSVVPGDGAIRVLFGGLDPNRKFDVASQGRRQPGSSFKPFVYLSALESGIDPRSTLDAASPKTLDCKGAPWTVHNFEGEGSGQMTIDDGMAHSINTVFAQLMAMVGPGSVQHVAEKAGESHDDVQPAECALALGGLRHGVSPLEHAAAYATFAARGMYAQPYGVAKITDRKGRVVYEHHPKTAVVIDRTEVGVLTAALRGVVDRGTGTAAGIGRPLAGKTGTTENYGNAWFIGYVPQLATAVWVGNPDSDVPMTNVHGISVAGGTYPARIFSSYMRAALAGVPVVDLETASPDALPLHSLNPTTTTSSTTTTTAPPAPPAGQPVAPAPTVAPPTPGPAPGPSPSPTYAPPPPPPPPPRQATTTTSPTTTTTVKR